MRRSIGRTTMVLLLITAGMCVAVPAAAESTQQYPQTITQSDVSETVQAYDEATAAYVLAEVADQRNAYWVNERTERAYRVEYKGDGKVVQTYRDGNDAVYRVLNDGLETSTGETDELHVSTVASGPFLADGMYVGDATATFSGTTTFNGRAVGVYTATGQAAAAAMDTIDGSWVTEATASDAVITLYATSDGRVVHVSYNRPALQGEASVTVRGLGSTAVPEPSWVGTPRGEVTVEAYDFRGDGSVGIEVVYGGNLERLRIETADGTVLRTVNGADAVLEEPRAPRGFVVDAATVGYDVRGETIRVVGETESNSVVLTTYTVPRALSDTDRELLRYIERQ